MLDSLEKIFAMLTTFLFFDIFLDIVDIFCVKNLKMYDINEYL